MCPYSKWANILWAQCSILCNSMGEGKFWPGKSKHILSFICWMLKQCRSHDVLIWLAWKEGLTIFIRLQSPVRQPTYQSLSVSCFNPAIRDPFQQTNWAAFHHTLYLPKSPRGSEWTNMSIECAQFVANGWTTPLGHMDSLQPSHQPGVWGPEDRSH